MVEMTSGPIFDKDICQAAEESWKRRLASLRPRGKVRTVEFFDGRENLRDTRASSAKARPGKPIRGSCRGISAAGRNGRGRWPSMLAPDRLPCSSAKGQDRAAVR